jgi:hypothetical protein
MKPKELSFQLIHKESGIPFGQYKSKHKLRYYVGNRLVENDWLKDNRLKTIVRADGAIGFQNVKPGYGDSELLFLKREEWEIKVTS